MEKINLDKIIEDINNLDVPLYQSAFQSEMWVVNTNLTPARKKRQCKLELDRLIHDFAELEYVYEKDNLDIEEMERINSLIQTDEYTKKMNNLKIKKILITRDLNEKKLKEKEIELAYFYKMYKELPGFTRREFEMQERDYYEKKLALQISGLNEKGQFEFALMGNNSENLQKITDNLLKEMLIDKKHKEVLSWEQE
jgi:hypothetical protein